MITESSRYEDSITSLSSPVAKSVLISLPERTLENETSNSGSAIQSNQQVVGLDNGSILGLEPFDGEKKGSPGVKLLQDDHVIEPASPSRMEPQVPKPRVLSSEDGGIPKEYARLSSQASGCEHVDSASAEKQLCSPAIPEEKIDGNLFASSPNGHVSSDKKSIVITDAPFESVKAAVKLFGEGVDWKLLSQALKEGRVAPGFDAEKAKQEILKDKEKLNDVQTFIVNVRHELDGINEQIRSYKVEVPAVSICKGGLPASEPEKSSFGGVAANVHMDLLAKVESAQKEIEEITVKQLQLEKIKQSELKEMEMKLRAKDDSIVRVKELLEHYAAKQKLMETAKNVLAELESVIASLSSAYMRKLENTPVLDSALLKLGIMKTLDSPVSNYEILVQELMKELSTMRDVEITTYAGELLAARVRLEQMKIAEGKRVAALGRALEQLDESKLNLKKAIDAGVSLSSAINTYQVQISKRQAELEGAHETEQIACATLASLQDELCSIRAKVLSAQAGEVKAIESRRKLPADINKMALSADEAKATSKMARELASKARLEMEQAKAGLSTALSRIQAAEKEAEAARASEAMALAGLKALSGSEGEDGKVSISIPFEEYSALYDAGHEAVKVSDKKVGVTLIELKEAAANEAEGQDKLSIALKELEELQKALEAAQKKADDSQAAKLSIESELRKWRADHDHWRKTGSNPSSVNTSATQSPRFLNGKTSHTKAFSHSFQGKTVAGIDPSLAEFLTLKVPISEQVLPHSFHGKPATGLSPSLDLSAIKVPSLEKEAGPTSRLDVVKTSKPKKLSLFARVVSMMVRKKKKPVN
ncbi:hypothetical protein KP509_23G058000 [Ceratopteris richardii]|uniref:Uncharacterized protein n=1 Tax=Ceratopteris richardii TaxID=49495 RepID=A0A8T2S219_CERRI|nr:hypothetical protein KP509_23G058000 [Ceratopteris richardii]